MLAFMDFEFLKAQIMNVVAPQNMKVKEKLQVLKRIFENRKSIKFEQKNNSQVFKDFCKQMSIDKEKDLHNIVKILKVK